MPHLLNNPIWEALNSGASSYAYGSDGVRFIDRKMGFFAGLPGYDAAQLDRLYAEMDWGMRVILFTPGTLDLDQRWEIHNNHELLQLVCERKQENQLDHPQVRPLDVPDVEQMLALVRLTKPGPFLEKTIDFGAYYGYFVGDRLVSMAGSRLAAGHFTEVSAVCTHPDFVGQGLAKQVLPWVLHRLQAQGQIPFLHLYPENTAAYRLYQSLGFVPRAGLRVYSLEKKAAKE